MVLRAGWEGDTGATGGSKASTAKGSTAKEEMVGDLEINSRPAVDLNGQTPKGPGPDRKKSISCFLENKYLSPLA
jgi:hypothetical protein